MIVNKRPPASAVLGIRSMMQSHVIEVDGNFVGAAVVETCGYRFVAVDLKLGEMDGSVWPQLSDLRRAARRLSLSTRFAGATLPV